MAGYSGTPLPRKLGIKEGSDVVLVGAPDGFEASLEPLPDGAAVVRGTSGAEPGGEPGRAAVDVAVLFVTERAALEEQFALLSPHVQPAGGVWIAWPKRSSGVATDLSENVLREVLLPTGWVDNKVCSVDGVWSGLRFVRRLSAR